MYYYHSVFYSVLMTRVNMSHMATLLLVFLSVLSLGSFQGTRPFPSFQFGGGSDRFRSSGDGQYRPDNGGSYDGRYENDDSGRYVHVDNKYEHVNAAGGQYSQQQGVFNRYQQGNSGSDSNDGQYRPDNSGRYDANDGQYHPDDAGRYVHDDKKYEHVNVGGGDYQHQGDKNDKYRPDQNGNNGYNPDRYPSGSGSGSGGRLPNPTNHGTSGGERVQSGRCSYDNLRNYQIIRQEGEVYQDAYHYLYETENCMYGEERGQLHNKGTADEVMRAEGVFHYVGPDNVKYTVTYTADENGFRPQGDHIPRVPEAILRSLEYKKSIGEL